MEYKSITPEQREQLRKPLPKEAVSKHPTKKFMDSIKPMFVIERLNDVFGVGKWRQESKEVSVSEKGMVVVHSKLIIPEYDIILESYGGNDNQDRGDAFKGSVTDALTKMCSFLEIGIDIFKGLGNDFNAEKSEAPQQQVTTPIKPKEKALIVVNNDKYRAALKYLEKNGLKAWETVSSNYTISLADEAQLLKEASELIVAKQQ